MESVKVGKKPMMFYALLALKKAEENGKVKIVARGINIVKAVDIAEYLRKYHNLKIEKVSIGSDLLEVGWVSRIEIEVVK